MVPHLQIFWSCLILGYPVIGDLVSLMNKENQKNWVAFHQSLANQLGDIYKLRYGCKIVCVFPNPLHPKSFRLSVF